METLFHIFHFYSQYNKCKVYSVYPNIKVFIELNNKKYDFLYISYMTTCIRYKHVHYTIIKWYIKLQ